MGMREDRKRSRNYTRREQGKKTEMEVQIGR